MYPQVAQAEQFKSKTIDSDRGEEVNNEFEIFRKFDERIDLNKGEINKLFQALADVQEKLSKLDPDKIKDGLDKVNAIEEGIRSMPLRKKSSLINQIQQEITDRQQTIANLFQPDPFEDKEMIELINNVTKDLKEKVKNLTSKFEHMSFRQDNITGEILGRIKKDLSGESNRILEEFKTNLKSSMSRIEDKLSEKVDKLNLDEIARKIDSKIIQEVSKKLDKNDLKKNTTIMNKKVPLTLK